MNKKECKRLAIKIAEAEKLLKDSTDEDEKRYARSEILYLSEKITDFKDLEIIDNYIQEILDKDKIF